MGSVPAASVPAGARVYAAAAVLAAGACLVSLPQLRTPWWAVTLLAAVYAACGQAGRRAGIDAFYPVLLAAAFLLPPPAAALVAVPGTLLSPVADPPRLLRRLWRAAVLCLSVHATAWTYWVLGGRDAVVASHLPRALAAAALAVLVFCLCAALLDGGMKALADRVPAREPWWRQFVRSLPPMAVHGLAGVMMAVLWRSPHGPAAAVLVLLPMYVTWWVFAHSDQERTAHRSTVRALVRAVDLKDNYTRGHSERVGQASVMIARELGMADERVEVIRFAGILHDVGKIGVPTRLLRKDGPLTPQERRAIELHPEYGHEMTRGIGFLEEARAAILHHHERLDGSGYPYGLAGGRIPECARVVAVADAFDAMTSTRSYRRARPVPTALEELARCAGTQFDPRMVTALTRALERHGWNPVVTSDDPTPFTAPSEPTAPGRPAAPPAPAPAPGEPAGSATPAPAEPTVRAEATVAGGLRGVSRAAAPSTRRASTRRAPARGEGGAR
ncbi:HD-GYP domain-containing protein [Streptomyces fragilis]|uniref:HD-GYP domain-containing protein n=1 Tax=Streptomyces fragilis TaxID=67301 RepID=A0ABV2YMB0_9ACTN|nr:HD-GYP domain-containing protein [Streptomyces fragilis]